MKKKSRQEGRKEEREEVGKRGRDGGSVGHRLHAPQQEAPSAVGRGEGPAGRVYRFDTLLFTVSHLNPTNPRPGREREGSGRERWADSVGVCVCRYNDDHYEYRHVQLPKQMLKKIPKDYFDGARGTLKLLWEDEWRGLGITQVSLAISPRRKTSAASRCVR